MGAAQNFTIDRERDINHRLEELLEGIAFERHNTTDDPEIFVPTEDDLGVHGFRDFYESAPESWLDMREEYAKLGSLEAFKQKYSRKKHAHKIPYDVPVVLNSGNMAIGFIDVAGSANLGRYAKEVGLDRNALISIFGRSIKRNVERYGGEYKVIAGDLHTFVLGQDPLNSPFEDTEHSMVAALDVGYQSIQALSYEATEQIKREFIRARFRQEFAAGRRKITEKKFERIYSEVSERLGKIFGTGKEGHANASFTFAAGANTWRVTKTRKHGEDHWETDFNGDTADLCGRASKYEINGRQIGAFLDELVVEDGKTVINPRTRKTLTDGHHSGPILIQENSIPTSLGGNTFYLWFFDGFRHYENRHFLGRIRRDSPLSANIDGIRARLDPVADVLAGMKAKYRLKLNPNVPDLQRGDLTGRTEEQKTPDYFELGIARIAAAIGKGIYHTIRHLDEVVDAKPHKYDRSKYKALRQMKRDIFRYGEDNLAFYQLIRDVARYYVTSPDGYTYRETRRDTEVEEQRLDLEVQYATELFTKWAEKGPWGKNGIKEVKKAKLPILAQHRYTSYEDFFDLQWATDRGDGTYKYEPIKNIGGIALAKEIADISDRWARLVSARHDRPKYSHERALEKITAEFSDSPVLDFFLLSQGKKPTDDIYRRKMMKGYRV